jgi:hypothetical protein
MIDTNSIVQLGQTAQAVKNQISPWLPAMAVAAAWLGRELNRLAAWSAEAAEKIMAHGGVIKIAAKLFWNEAPSPPPSPPMVEREPTAQEHGPAAGNDQ